MMATGSHETSTGGHLSNGASLCGRYMITGVLRDDGGSTLYVGRTTALAGEPVMIKEVVPDGFVAAENRANAHSRFLREVQVLQELKHPALPIVLDAFAEKGRHYLVMSYCPGETLGTMLERRGRPFEEDDVVGWALEILSALGLMHRHSPPVIYRNLSPSNIVIDPNGLVRLLDFGLARFYTQGKRMDTAPIGSSGYAPPEQISGTTDARSDLYALGVTMHHLLTNTDPTRHASAALPPASCNPDVSVDLAAIIARAVEFEPSRRWPSAAEMEMVLRRHIVSSTATPRPRSPFAAIPDAVAAHVDTGARLVLYGVRPTGGRDEVLYHLMRLTWMPRRELLQALADLPAILPLVEPYKASLRVLKGLGVDARPIWPLHGMHALDGEANATLQSEGRVFVEDSASLEEGVFLCRHCHFGWMADSGEGALPESCPSCGRYTWNKITLVRCGWCGHESEDRGSAACSCCGLTVTDRPGARSAAPRSALSAARA